MPTARLEPRFLETIPEQLEEDVLYISIRFRVAIHLCCCGCGNKAITPFSPARWKMTYDGKTVTLFPSIGNTNLACESHYWIERNEVEWAGKLTRGQVQQGKIEEKRKREAYYKEVNSAKVLEKASWATLVVARLIRVIKSLKG